MQRTRQTYQRYALTLVVTLFLHGTSASAPAQTLLSPAPIMPISGLSIPVSSVPAPSERPAEPGDEAGSKKKFHIPLVLNESVESQIEFFTTTGRAVFQNWLGRSVRYLPLMKQIFSEHNLPEDLVYIAMIESGFNPQAVSPRKAAGPWQFMLETAREYGLTINRWVDERRDPVKSTHAAALHLKNLYNTFGSWLMALASYNAGTGRMQSAVFKAKSDDFWDISASRILHSETREYVPRYLAALMIAKNPAAYGFEDPESKPIEFDEVVVASSTDLRKIAGFAGSSYEELRELNPELLLHATPHSRYVLRVPAGTAETCKRKLTARTEGKRSTVSSSSKKRASRLAAYPFLRPGAREQSLVSRFGAELDSGFGRERTAEASLSPDNLRFTFMP